MDVDVGSDMVFFYSGCFISVLLVCEVEVVGVFVVDVFFIDMFLKKRMLVIVFVYSK